MSCDNSKNDSLPHENAAISFYYFVNFVGLLLIATQYQMPLGFKCKHAAAALIIPDDKIHLFMVTVT